jgi:putative flippase GtrA
MLSRRFTLFVLVGGLAAAINIAARWLVNLFTSFEVAIVVAFFVALAVAFLLNRRLVFGSEGSSVDQFRRFLLVNLVALAQVWLVSMLLARMIFPALGFTWNADTIAHAVGVVSPLAASYLAHKHFTFAKMRDRSYE